MRTDRPITILLVLLVLPAIVMPELPTAWAAWLDWWLTAAVLTAVGVPVLFFVLREGFHALAAWHDESAPRRHAKREARRALRRREGT